MQNERDTRKIQLRAVVQFVFNIFFTKNMRLIEVSLYIFYLIKFLYLNIFQLPDGAKKFLISLK